MTVVETSTSISCAAKALIVASFNSLGSRPCRGATRTPLSAPVANSGASASTLTISGVLVPLRKSISASSLSPALMREATTYA